MTTLKQALDMVPIDKERYFRMPYRHFKFADDSLFADYVLFVCDNTHKWYTEPHSGPDGWKTIGSREKPAIYLKYVLKKPEVASLIEASVKTKLMANLKVEKDAYQAQHQKPDPRQDEEVSITQESLDVSEEMTEEMETDDENDVEQQLPTPTQEPAHPVEYVEDLEQANKTIAELRLEFQAFQDKTKEDFTKLWEEKTELKLEVLALQDKRKEDKEMYMALFDSSCKDTPNYEAIRKYLLLRV